MKALQIFHACLAFSCVATFVAHQKYERVVEPGGASRILDVAVPQSSYAWEKMMRQKIQTPLKEYFDNAKPESDKVEFV